MVDRERAIELLNSKNYDELLVDYCCEEHKHTIQEVQLLINVLQQIGQLDWFIHNIIFYYIYNLHINSVSVKNNNNIISFMPPMEYKILYYY